MRPTLRRAAVAAALAALAGWTAPALADASVDQSNVAATPVSTWQTIANNVFVPSLNQTFDLAGLQIVTAGVSGQLTQVDAQLAQALNPQGAPVPVGTGVLYIARNPVIDSTGSATADALYQLGFNTTAINGFDTWTTFDLSSQNINFVAGDTFAVAFGGTDNNSLSLYRWATTSSSAYAGGDGYVGIDGTAQNNYTWFATGANIPARDYGFRTWMQSVPEPGTWLLMIVGFGFVGVALRRRPARLGSAARIA